MAGYRIPGPTGTAPESQPTIDDGTLARVASPSPGTLGTLRATASDAAHWLRSVRTALTWSELRSGAFRLLHGPGFGLGVAAGIGESAVASAAELADLVRVFVLADVHDVTQGAIRTLDRLPATALRASLDPFVASSAAQALKEARADKDAMIDGLRYAFAHPGEVLGSLAEEYVEKWRRFEALDESATLRARYEAGKLFGELLLLLLGAVSAGAGLGKLVQKVPALARVERRITRAAGGLQRHGASGRDAKAAQAAPEPSVPPGKSPADAPKSNKDKALIGQDRGRAYMESRGFERLTDDKRWNAPGVDDIWRSTKPPPDYVITEYKYGQSRLGLTRDGLQASDDWLNGVVTGRDRLKAALGESEALNVRISMDNGRVEKWLLRSDSGGGFTKSVLDAAGHVLKGAAE
jgi:hypothetical protein